MSKITSVTMAPSTDDHHLHANPIVVEASLYATACKVIDPEYLDKFLKTANISEEAKQLAPSVQVFSEQEFKEYCKDIPYYLTELILFKTNNQTVYATKLVS